MAKTTDVGSTANQYQILAKLAVGGMAEIFLARGASVAGVERYCVLKRILRERAGDAQFVQMFVDEARLASQLQHPNIAAVYDVGVLGDSYFFTMEYVHGETVRSLLDRAEELHRPLPLACVLTIIAGTASGLHHAHERNANDGRPLGIVHRDVSPSNLMVSFEGNIKIVDFGVAKADDRAVETQAGMVKGKISYLSPEQCRGERVDRRSDLFSLGIVLWEMLTGKRLYRRDSDFASMTAIVKEPPPPPSSRRPEVPRAIDDIVLRLLAKSVTDRFQTADQVVEAIENASMRAGTLLSTSAVSRLVRDLFGHRPEPWLEIGNETLPHEAVSLASHPSPENFESAPRDWAEAAAVPELSISKLFDYDDDLPAESTSSKADTKLPQDTVPLTSPARRAMIEARSRLPTPPAPPSLDTVPTFHQSPLATSPPPPPRFPRAASQPGAPETPAAPPLRPDPPSAPTVMPSRLPPHAAVPRGARAPAFQLLRGLPQIPPKSSAATLRGISASASSRLSTPPVPDLSTTLPSAEGTPEALFVSASISTVPNAPTLIAPPNSPSDRSIAPPAAPAWSPRNTASPPPFPVAIAIRLGSASEHSPAIQHPATHNEPTPVPFPAPSSVLPPSAFGASSLATTSVRPHKKQTTRVKPPLLAVLLLAPIVGAIAAWLSMRGEHGPLLRASVQGSAPVASDLADAGSIAITPAPALPIDTAVPRTDVAPNEPRVSPPPTPADTSPTNPPGAASPPGRRDPSPPRRSPDVSWRLPSSTPPPSESDSPPGTINALFDKRDYAGVLGECSVAKPGVDVLRNCFLAACYQKNLVWAQRWLPVNPAGTRAELMAQCKRIGLDLEQ